MKFKRGPYQQWSRLKIVVNRSNVYSPLHKFAQTNKLAQPITMPELYY